VREFKLDYTYLPEARRTYDSLNGIHQDDVDHRVDFLCERPEPDDEITFAWPEEGPNVFIFYDDAWVMTYALVDDVRVVKIWSLAPVGWLRPSS
jgi:hypothetical protein